MFTYLILNNWIMLVAGLFSFNQCCINSLDLTEISRI